LYIATTVSSNIQLVMFLSKKHVVLLNRM